VNTSQANCRIDPAAALLVEELIDKVQAGEDVDAFIASHEERAETLRRLLPALRVMADLSNSAEDELGGLEGGGPALGELGDFRIIREVGRGGMGIVYEAEQISLGRRVALKVLPFGATMDPRQLQRFQNEARAAASLEHPNIVPVYGVGCERGVHYYAMKFVEGQSLAGLIEAMRQPSEPRPSGSGGSQPLADHRGSESTSPMHAFSTQGGPRDPAAFRQIAAWGIQAAEALEHAHSVGIVHRDVKPANLMIDGHGALWITDFGLARTAVDAGLTMTGDVLGTLRYMSPEQALAKHGLVDHRTDVYSLGVTLYELLTGTPAVNGNDREEILNAITLDEPRPPRALEAAIPTELETIVLKAMEKSPADRYGTAQEIADDLERFLKDEPIRARRPRLRARLARWGRRHKPLVAAATAALLVGLAVLAGSFGWIAQEQAVLRANNTQAVNAAMEETDSWQGQRRLPEALSAARRADRLVAGADVDQALGQQVRRRLADLELLDRLENIRLVQGTAVKDGQFDWERVNALYAKTFLARDLDILGLTPEEAGERLRSTTVTVELAAMLDDWVGSYRKKVGKNGPDWKHLLQVARAADADPWRTRVREAIEREDWKGLRSLAVSDDVFRLPPATLAVVGGNLLVDAEKDRAIEAFLRESQRRHPNDFWLNHNLVTLFLNRQPARSEEALPFAAVAVALRPDSSGAHSNLGNVLHKIGRLDEAIAEHAEAVRLNRHDALAHINLSVCLADKGRLDKAIAECHEAISLKQCLPLAYYNLGVALQKKGESGREEAIAAYRQAIKLDKNFAQPHYNLGNALRSKRQWDDAAKEYLEAIRIKKDHAEAYCNLGNTWLDLNKPRDAEDACRKAIEFKPALFNAYNSLGASLYRQGKLPQAEKAYGKAIELKPDFALAYSGLGNVLRLLNKLSQAEAACRKATELDSKFAGAHYNLGLTLQSQRRLPEAEAAYREAIELRPGYAEAHCNLGHTLREQGRFADALAELKQGHELGSPWGYPSAQWVRETERLVELDVRLPKVLKGKLQPADVGERLALANLCLEYKALYLAAFRFYRDAFAERPNLAHDLQNQPRYNAARAAAMAGCSQGKDANKLDAKECAGLRQQSLKWLRADLAAYRWLLDKEPEKAAPVTRQRLQHWEQNRDFIGLRDPEALAKLPEADQAAWRQLWVDVAATLERTQRKPGLEKRRDTK